MRLLNKLFNIRQNEWPRFLLLYLMLFLIFAGLTWGSLVVEASFLQQIGVEALPIFFIIKALISIPAVAIYAAFADRVSNQKLLVAILLIAILFIGLGIGLASVGLVLVAFPLLYLLIFVPLDDILFTHWYTYVYTLYDTRAAKRIVPVLATAGGVASIFGGLSLLLLNRFLAPMGIIILWAAALFAVVLLVWLEPSILRGEKGTVETEDEKVTGDEEAEVSYIDNMKEGYRYVFQSPFLRWMALFTLLLMLFLTFLEYRTGQILLAEFGTVQELSNFLGVLTSVANLIILPIQLFFLSRIISRIGLGNSNLIFPVGALAVSGGILLAPTKLVAALAYIVRLDFYNNFGYLTNSLLYNAVPLRIKGRARAFVGGFVVPIGALIGGLLLLFPLITNEQVLGTFIALLAISLLLVGILIRRQYTLALVEMLEEEDFSSLLSQEVSNLTVTDPSMLNWLKNKLKESSSPEFTIFMAKLISQIGGREAVSILGSTVRETDNPRLRTALLDVLVASEIEGGAVHELYTDFLTDPDALVRQSAFAGLEQQVQPGDEQFTTLAQEMVHDPDAGVQIRVLSALVRSGKFYSLPTAVQVLSELLADEDIDRRSNGVRVLGQLGDARAIRNLADYLDDPADEVRLEAATAVETISETKLPEETLYLILDPVRNLVTDPVERIRQAALTVLGRIGSHDSIRVLAQALSDSSPEVRAAVVNIIVETGKAVIPTIHPQLDSPDPQLRKMAAVVLCRINPREFGALITSHITGNLIIIYRNYVSAESLSACTQYAGLAVLQNTLREQSQALTDEIFYLLTALHNPSTIKVIVQSFKSEEARIRANATEALEALTTPQTARLIEPLFDPQLSMDKLLGMSQETWDMDCPEPAQFIRQLVTDSAGDPWLQTIATFALGEIGATAWANVNAPGETAQGEASKEVPPQAPVTPPAKEERGRRRQPLDLFNSLMEDSPKDKPPTEEAPKSRRRRVNPLDLLSGLEDSAEPEKDPPSPSADIMETTMGSATFSSENVRRLSQKQTAVPQTTHSPCDSLFSLLEIEAMLAQALVSPVNDVRLAVEAANRIMSGIHISEVAQKEEVVLSIIEKIIFLKEVPFFQGMTVDQLKVLANVCEEVLFSADTRIFEQGDSGGILYVVINGRVAIEQEKRKGSYARLATLGPHTYFGEMNLFDNSSRSAAAIALKDTLALRLRREPLIALARQHPGLSLELINVLSARLRETSDRIAELTKTRPRELHKLFDQFD